MRHINFRRAIEAQLLNPGLPYAALSKAEAEQQDALRSRSVNEGQGLIIPFKLGEHEQRDLSVSGGTTQQYGGDLVGTDVPEAGPALREQMQLSRLGARILSGLRNDVDLPYGATAISAEWLSENGSATDASAAFGVLSMRPKRVAATVPVSTQLILQGGMVFDQWLRTELMDALAVEIERVAIAGTGSNNQPKGILYTPGIGAVTGGTNGAAPDLADLCDLEYAVTGTGKADRGPLGWLLSPKLRKKLRQTASNGTGSQMLWPLDSADKLLGHLAGVTPAVPDNLTKGSASGVCSALIFGKFSELLIGLYGAGIEIDVFADRALSLAGKVQVTATCYVDCGVRNPKAFAAMQDALAA